MPLILDAGNYYLDRHGRRVAFPGGRPGLLDGRGGRLEEGMPAATIEWSVRALQLGLASNSAGESFTAWETRN